MDNDTAFESLHSCMKIAKILITLFIVVFGVTVWLAGDSSSSTNTDEFVTLKIATGDSVSDVVEELKYQGVIRSKLLFSRYLQRNDLDTKIRTGMFQIPKNASYAEIAAVFTKEGEHKEGRFTIPEGYTLAQIDALLAEKDWLIPGEILSCAKDTCDFSTFDFLPDSGSLEGYLFPDTYFVRIDTVTAESVLTMLLRTFEKKVVSNLQSEIDDSKYSLDQLINMASLIERETRTSDERPLVSGILWKRFDNNVGLGVDATVRYVLNKPTGPLTVQDLAVESPFNTRKYRGLPPTPIANPGLSSIFARLLTQRNLIIGTICMRQMAKFTIQRQMMSIM